MRGGFVEKWIRFRGDGPGYQYHMASNKFIVQLTGGSIIIRDRYTREMLKRYTGHHYLYTGDISPDETKCFALENGKHFYVYSLQDFELIKRVTLPKTYESMDMYGHYSEDGKFIYIPAARWVRNPHISEGCYELLVFKYETEDYTLIDKKALDTWDSFTDYRWRLGDLWDQPKEIKLDADVDAIMKIIFGNDRG